MSHVVTVLLHSGCLRFADFVVSTFGLSEKTIVVFVVVRLTAVLVVIVQKDLRWSGVV